ncbi:MAG TPA: hypothetical protein VGM88_32050 [Kofleriaceae bacterium]
MKVALATPRELPGILSLQRANLRVASPDGFVTVEHTPEALRALHDAMPSVVALDGDEVVGYALAMAVAARTLLPTLEPMFAVLDTLALPPYYVMGQVCVAPAARGSGVFDAMYAEHRRAYGGAFAELVTEVSLRNPRSLRAHARVGFRELHRYRDATDEWSVIGWRLA